MAISWSTRRKALYTGVAGLVAVALFFTLWQVFFTTAPTCSDGAQNGDERGVDCGGSCALVCAEAARAPRVLWARSFETAPSLYTAASYVENLNTGAGARRVRYSFQLLDSDNLLVVQRDGVVDIPAVNTVPIVEPNINVGQRTVARTLFAFAEVPQWYTLSAPQPVLRFSQQDLSADATRLTAVLTNDSSVDAARVEVVAVLFDAGGTARAASKSVVNALARRSSAPVVFTWPQGVPGIVRAELTALPSF